MSGLWSRLFCVVLICTCVLIKYCHICYKSHQYYEFSRTFVCIEKTVLLKDIFSHACHSVQDITFKLVDAPLYAYCPSGFSKVLVRLTIFWPIYG